MKKDSFTRDEVFTLLIALLMYDSANNGLDISSVPVSFGDKALHLLSVADNIDLNSDKSVLSALSDIRMI